MARMFGDFLTSIAKVDLAYTATNLVGINIGDKTFPAIIQSNQVNQRERAQVVQCFNDVIHMYAFGKEPTALMISGICPQKDMAELNTFYKSNRAYVGSPIKITSMQDIILQGVLLGMTYSLSADTCAFASFTMDFLDVGIITRLAAADFMIINKAGTTTRV